MPSLPSCGVKHVCSRCLQRVMGPESLEGIPLLLRDPFPSSILTESLCFIIFVLVAWENSWHLATLPLVSPPNDIWETSAEIPYWCRVTTQIWVVLLIGCTAWEIWFHQSEAISSGSIAKFQLYSQAIVVVGIIMIIIIILLLLLLLLFIII